MKEAKVENFNNKIHVTFYNGCLSTNFSSKNFDKMNIKALEEKLNDIGYSNLFLSDNQQLDRIWQNGENKLKLKQIINADSSTLTAIFLANEVLRNYNIESEKKNSSKLAEAYVFALKHTNIEKDSQLGLNANLWGLLYEENDVGHLGEMLISFGVVAVLFLSMLLNDNGSVLYEGGQEAMIGNAYQYRIKDFAAFYISRIKNTPIEFYQDIEERDREIERFKKSLNTD